MYGGESMETYKVHIDASEKLTSVEIPKEYRGKDLIVNFIIYDAKPEEGKRVDPKALAGIIRDPGLSIDELRAERLGKV